MAKHQNTLSLANSPKLALARLIYKIFNNNSIRMEYSYE